MSQQNLKTVLTKWKLEGKILEKRLLYSLEDNGKPYEIWFAKMEHWSGNACIIYRRLNGNYSLVYSDITHKNYGEPGKPDAMFIKKADISKLMDYT